MSSVESKGKGKSAASSNWLNLQKVALVLQNPNTVSLIYINQQLAKTENKGSDYLHKNASRKRQKLDETSTHNKFSKLYITSNEQEPSTSSQAQLPTASSSAAGKNGVSTASLQQMIFGHTEYTESQKL